MSYRTTTSLICAVALLCAPRASDAQLSTYNMPVERGILESHIDLQYQYSSYDVPGGDSVNVSVLSVEGQFALSSVELSINVPFVTHGWASSPDSTAFGDLMVGGKYKVFGVGKTLGIALFLNATLPTHSGDFTRSYAQLQGGGAISASVIGFEVGGGVQTHWTIIGDDQDDLGLIGFYGFGRFPILGLIALQAAVEYFNSMHPGGDLNALLITPSVEVSVAWFHAGVGARIAATDDGMAVSRGRVAVLGNAGIRF